MKIYFVRHGESEANTKRVISNRESPFGLTKSGRRQAKLLANNIKEVSFTKIFSSPFRRAMETTDVLSKAIGKPYQVTEALREYDCGILEGKSDDISWMLHRKYSNDWTLHHNLSSKPEGGESFVDIQKRFLPFIESLKQGNDEHILLVGHGGLFQLMLPLILTNIDNDFVREHGIGHTDCIIAEHFIDGFVCIQWENIQL